MIGTGARWSGQVFTVAPADVARWSVDLAAAVAAAGAGPWFFVELEPGRIEAAVAGEPPAGWGRSGASDTADSSDAPWSLTPSLFPAGIVPASYVESLVVGTASVVEAHRSGVPLDAAAELSVFYEVLVDAAERDAVCEAAAAWLDRVADATGDVEAEAEAQAVADGPATTPGGTGVIEPPGGLRRELAAIRPILDADVARLAGAGGIEPSVVRSQLVARAAHAHLTRVWGSGPSRLRAEASLLRRPR